MSTAVDHSAYLLRQKAKVDEAAHAVAEFALFLQKQGTTLPVGLERHVRAYNMAKADLRLAGQAVPSPVAATGSAP